MDKPDHRAPARRAAQFCVLLLGAVHAFAEPRILIVGDSWAMSLSAENVDGFPAHDVFDAALAANGLAAAGTRGANTAWGGRRASGWAKPENLARIRNDLEAHPTLDIVHLIVGGNDFLALAEQPDFKSRTAAQRQAAWDAIAGDVETIARACTAIRPGIRVVLAGYDYLDFDAAAAFWKKSFHGVGSPTLNGWLVELSRTLRDRIMRLDRCRYLNNFGILQHRFGTPPGAVPLPGQAPGFEPWPGGDPAKPMPPGLSPDGIHPNDAAHTALLENAIDTCYRAWLAPRD